MVLLSYVCYTTTKQKYKMQKQPFTGALGKRCSENTEQIYRHIKKYPC